MATCIITGSLKLPSGAVAPYAKLRVVRAVKTGVVIMRDPVDYTASSAGVVTFDAIQGSTTYVYCNSNGLDTYGPRGVALAIPSASTANLEDLVEVTTDQVGTITASRAAVSNSSGYITASTTTAAQILALASLTASRALVSDSSGSIVHATTTATQLNSLATLTAGSIPYLSATGVFAPTSGPGALIDSMGQPTYPNFTVKQTTASTLEDMIIVKNAAGTAVWALDILANSNISFLDYVNNKNVITLAAGATYTYLQLLSTAGINFAGTGTVASTSMGLSRVSTTALAVTGGATIAAGGAYRDLGLRNLLVNGTSSGVVTIAGAAAAGTWTLTLPTDGGTVNYFLQTDGSGTTTWAAAAGASAALDNLASVNINTSLLAQTGVDLGSTTKPFRDLYLFGSGTYGTTYIKQTGTPTSTRTITWPDATGIPAISASALTSTRVPFATTGGLLTDDAAVRYTGTVFYAPYFDATTGFRIGTTLVLYNSGTQNIFVGVGAGNGSVTGNSNSAIGHTSLVSVTSGSGNVAIGYQAGNKTTTGGNNTFIGQQAGYNNIGSNANVGIGSLALFTNTSDASSVAIGQGALQFQNGSNGHNVAIGVQAGQNLTTGYSNILLGVDAGSGFNLTGHNRFIAGSTTHPIANAYFGSGDLDTTPQAWILNGTGGSGTNIAGADITFAGGIGTGTGAGGAINFQAAPAGSTGSTPNTLVTILRLASPGLAVLTCLDAVSNTLTTLETYQHNSSGTPAASFGSRVLFNLHSSTTTNQNAGSIDVYWSDATHATRTSVVALCAVNSAAALAEVFKVTGAGLMTPLDGGHFALGTTTGTKIGTGTTQKLGFWNVTPVVQQVLATGAGATVDNVITFLQTIGLCKQS